MQNVSIKTLYQNPAQLLVNPPTLGDVNFGDIKERESLPLLCAPFFLLGSLPFILLLLCRVERLSRLRISLVFGGAWHVCMWHTITQQRERPEEIPNICYPKQNGYTAISAEFPHGRLYTHLGAFVWIIIFAFLMRTAFGLSHSFWPFCCSLCVLPGLFQIFIRNGGQM